MSQKTKKVGFHSYRQKREYEKTRNPRRADWSGLLIELQKETIQKKEQKENANKKVNNNGTETN